MTASKIAVVTFERNKEAAVKVARHVGGDIFLYKKGIFGDLMKSYDAIVAMFATGIAVREIVPFLSGKWSDPALVVVDSGLTFAIPVLGGHHGGNEVARRLKSLGILPVVTTATEVHDKISVEGIAGRLNCDVRNKYSTIAVNSALLDGDVDIVYVQGPKIVIVDKDVSVLVRRDENKFYAPDEDREIPLNEPEDKIYV